MNTQNVKTAATKTTETWAEGQNTNYYLEISLLPAQRGTPKKCGITG